MKSRKRRADNPSVSSHSAEPRDLWYDLTGLDQQVPPDRKPSLDADVLASCTRFAEGDMIKMPATIVVASGRA